MDYKKVLRLHYVSKLSSREIAAVSGSSKTAINEFLKRFRESNELDFPLPEAVTNELIEEKLYHKSGPAGSLYRDFDKEAVYRALAKKGETLKHLWQKYNAKGVVDGLAPMSYRQYCRRYSEWMASRNVTIHIPRCPGVNIELDYAGKTLVIHSRSNPAHTTKVTVFIAALTYSDYFYAEGMTSCEIKDWIRVNNNALDFFGGVTPTITPDNCKVAVTSNRDWISPALNKDFQAWADHNDTVITPAKVKSPRWKPVVEGHVKIMTMHILLDMSEMTFYSLEELNRVLWSMVAEENRRNFQGLNYSRLDVFEQEEKETLLPLPKTHFEYLERKVVTVAPDFSFIFDKVHYTMPRRYLRKEVEIRAGEHTIYVYNKQGLPIHYVGMERGLYDQFGDSMMLDLIPIMDRIEALLSKEDDAVTTLSLNPILSIQGQKVSEKEMIDSNISGAVLHLDDGQKAEYVNAEMDYSVIKHELDQLYQQFNMVAAIPSSILGQPNIANVSENTTSIIYQLTENKGKQNMNALIDGFRERWEYMRMLSDPISDDDFYSLNVVFNSSKPVDTANDMANMQMQYNMGAISRRTIMEQSPYTTNAAQEIQRLEDEGKDITDPVADDE